MVEKTRRMGWRRKGGKREGEEEWERKRTKAELRQPRGGASVEKPLPISRLLTWVLPARVDAIEAGKNEIGRIPSLFPTHLNVAPPYDDGIMSTSNDIQKIKKSPEGQIRQWVSGYYNVLLYQFRQSNRAGKNAAMFPMVFIRKQHGNKSNEQEEERAI
ncbi:hypothetical protein OUZ56_019197 [Daphnia magna]|uniref:Uncharacterized protein n=1 Tax=Daphnia magna TaxID=35525 RepID=A0ABQ9ZB30_9CRUS|nr:hypothetical protein OUZ56_019197 [Daphnia magna]